MSDTVLTLTNISKSFKNQEVLEDISLQLSKGDLVYIQGINGSGKSTLLKIIAGLLEADAGSMILSDSTHIGALIENPGFADYSTIKENLAFLYGINHEKVDHEIIRGYCNSFGLDYDSNKYVRNYSVGMKQKMGIIQAVMEDQKLILLDEPTRGLDRKSAEYFKDLIQQLHEEGKTIIITAHEFIDLEYTSCLELENGRLYPSDRPSGAK